MTIAALALAAVLQVGAADTVPRVPADAYLDAGARELVARARARRATEDRSIAGYRVLARERVSVGFRALRRDRLLFRSEKAARIDWRREGVGRAELLGERYVFPIASPDVRGGSHADDNVAAAEAAALAFDPTTDEILHGFIEGERFRSPLADGSERDYRFATGDTTRIRLADGRTVSVVELRVLPRRREGRLFRGAIWLDLDTDAAVRAVFALAHPFDFVRDTDDGDDIPGILRPFRGQLHYLTIDYGLWEGRWWLPRLIALEAEAQVGRFLDVPVTFERSYEGYRVWGRGAAPVVVGAAEAADTSLVQERCDGDERCWRYVGGETPAREPDALIHSEYLPPSVYQGGTVLITEEELRELSRVLDRVGSGGAAMVEPRVEVRVLDPGMFRFNRVEGLAPGARVEADFGIAAADAEAWLGTAALDPSVEVGVRRERFGGVQRLAAYRRLAEVEPETRALGFGNSLSSLLLGRDDGNYFRATGAEVLSDFRPRGGWEMGLRLFVERHAPVEKNTDASLPRAFDESRTFHPNIEAEPAEQYGVAGSFRYARGLDPAGLRWSVRGSIAAERGTYRIVRPMATAFAAFPLPMRLTGAVEAAGGTTFGDVVIQREWFLGGASTIRGYGGPSRISGPAFWRTRAEAGTRLTGVRLAVFSDAGWAGAPEDVTTEPLLLSAGAGLGFLDGLFRIDLARRLRGERGWRLDLYFDGLL